MTDLNQGKIIGYIWRPVRHVNQIKVNVNFLVGKVTKIEYGNTKKATFMPVLKSENE